MQTEQFWQAIEGLEKLAQQSSTAIMCAEAVPWRCHRSLIADAFLTRTWTVLDIMSLQQAPRHKLTPFAKYVEGRLIYPAKGDEEAPRLFA
jgi:uncharacterized protein (DUF488 family)